MKKIIISLVIILSIILIPITTIWSHRNTIVSLDERINAQYVSNKSNYDNMWKKFREMTQVADLQANKIKEVYDGLISGRYNDTKLLFKVVHEQNPQLNQDTFVKLQNEIASSRNTFDNNQKQLADIIREYNTYVRKKFITANICGYKTKDMNNFIVTSERTTNAFDTKKDDEIKLK